MKTSFLFLLLNGISLRLVITNSRSYSLAVSQIVRGFYALRSESFEITIQRSENHSIEKTIDNVVQASFDVTF